MKKALHLIILAVVTIVSMSACRIEKVYDSKKPAKTYHLNLTGFSSLHNASNCDIHFVQSDTFKVTLKATQGWYDRHSVGVEKGVLTIKSDKYKGEKGVTVLSVNTYDDQAEMWVSAPSLTDVSLAGSGDFTIDSDLVGESLGIIRMGSGDTKTKNVTLTDGFLYHVSGSGDAQIGTIKAKDAKFSITGSGEIKSGLAGVANTELTISGSGDASLKFAGCDNADVTVTGSGDVTLSGQLKTLNKQVSGSGDVETSGLSLGK